MPRRSAADAALTRQAIVTAGRSLFADRGFAATSTNDVAHAAGVTRGAVYHHFADKSELFAEVFREILVELNTAVLLAGLEHEDARDMLAGAVRVLLAFAVRPDYRQIALLDAPGVLGLEEWQRVDSEVGMSSMEAGLTLLHEQGYRVGPAERAEVVLLFGALTEACRTVSRGGADAPDPEELVAAFMTLATDGAPRDRASSRTRRGS